MQTEVSAQQIEHFRQQGFLVLEGFLDAAELEHWRQVTEEAVRLRLTGSYTLTNQADPDTFYAQVFTQCLNLRDIHTGMADLIFDERLGRLAGMLAGVEGVRVWQDQALDDATLANGCLWYLPGTHREAKFALVPIAENLGDIFKSYPQWRKIAAVPAPCPAGSVIFHNALVAHGAGVNMTPYPRRAMTCAYMPDGSTFNGQQSLLPEAYFKSLALGDVLNNDQINRLVWRRAG